MQTSEESRNGPMATVIGPDMLTIVEEPVFIAPSEPYSKGSGFEVHEFFEAPSIRKVTLIILSIPRLLCMNCVMLPVNAQQKVFNVWKEYSADISIPDSIQALHFVYTGEGSASLASFTLE